MMELRPYQTEAVNAVYDFLRAKDTNPCVVAPTASGKSLMMAKIVTDAVTLWQGRVLLLAHVKELLEQNAGKIKTLCPEINVGIHSAGLGHYDTQNAVIVGGIQSVYKKAELLGAFDLILIDECHLIPSSGEGMYRTFLAAAKKINPNVRVIGFTATPFRLNGGLICKSDNILNEICYDIKIPYLMDNGYISRVVSKEGEAEADLTHLHLRGGEFIPDEIAVAMDSEDLVARACAEIVTKTRDRKSVIIFGASVAHCKHISDVITRLSGEPCPIVTGDTTADERAELLKRFKGEATEDLFGTVKAPRLKYLCNVNVLTTGFDAPAIDCVVLLRPTASAALYVQMVGRGFRLAPGKQDCLILDYGGNVLRHGPVNDIQVVDDGDGGSTLKEPKKPRVCPMCRNHVPKIQQVCTCGYQFPAPEFPKTHVHASSLSIVGERKTRGEHRDETYTVTGVQYFVHQKMNDPTAPATLRIEFSVAGQMRPIKIWKSPQSQSQWARHAFRSWWKGQAVDPNAPIPRTAHEAVLQIEVGAVLKRPSQVTFRFKEGSNFAEDIGYEFREDQELLDEPLNPEDWDDENLPF